MQGCDRLTRVEHGWLVFAADSGPAERPEGGARDSTVPFPYDTATSEPKHFPNNCRVEHITAFKPTAVVVDAVMHTQT